MEAMSVSEVEVVKEKKQISSLNYPGKFIVLMPHVGFPKDQTSR